MAARGVAISHQTAIAGAGAARGNRGVVGARIARVTGEGELAATTDRFACDLIAVSVGYHGTANLIHHARGVMSYDDAQAAFTVDELPAHMFAAGSVNGAYGLAAALDDGRRAGWQAAKDAGFEAGRKPASRAKADEASPNFPWPIFPHEDGKDFVDFDEDLQTADILNAIAEGYDNIELLKRFSTGRLGPRRCCAARGMPPPTS